MPIRVASKRNLPELADIAGGLLVHHSAYDGHYTPITDENKRKRLHRKHFSKTIKSPNSKFLVAWEDGAIAGYGIAAIKKNPPVLKERRYGEISEIFIREKYRGRGIATALLKALLAWLKKRGMKRAVILFDTRNEGARKAYRKAGFRPFQEKHSTILR